MKLSQLALGCNAESRGRLQKDFTAGLGALRIDLLAATCDHGSNVLTILESERMSDSESGHRWLHLGGQSPTGCGPRGIQRQIIGYYLPRLFHQRPHEDALGISWPFGPVHPGSITFARFTSWSHDIPGIGELFLVPSPAKPCVTSE